MREVVTMVLLCFWLQLALAVLCKSGIGGFAILLAVTGALAFLWHILKPVSEENVTKVNGVSEFRAAELRKLEQFEKDVVERAQEIQNEKRRIEEEKQRLAKIEEERMRWEMECQKNRPSSEVQRKNDEAFREFMRKPTAAGHSCRCGGGSPNCAVCGGSGWVE